MMNDEDKLRRQARRERIAVGAFSSLIVSPATDDDDWYVIADKAVMAADALIAALDQ